jgi:hypothetical protein
MAASNEVEGAGVKLTWRGSRGTRKERITRQDKERQTINTSSSFAFCWRSDLELTVTTMTFELWINDRSLHLK